MTDVSPILSGFATALAAGPLIACFVGVVMSTAVGVLPGVGPVTTIALLLPFTFGMSPTAAVIMLAGIYYGAQYRRIDDGDSPESAWRGVCGSHVSRRSCDGAAGSRAGSAFDRVDQLVCGWLTSAP